MESAPLLWVRCGCASVLYVPLHYVLRLDCTLPLVQLGVGVPGGAQCICHALCAGAEARPDHVTVATDVRNEFDTMHRSAVLQAVAERYPQLCTFVNWAYAPAAELWVHGRPNGHKRLWSTTGVRQGDRMGPLQFALGLQGPLQNLASEFPEVRVLAYLDDA